LRRAGATTGTVGRISVLAIAAALMVAAGFLPVIGLAGVAARDVANTFNTLPVGTLGTPPARSVMYAADGRVLTYLYPNNIYRIPVTFSQIAPDMRDAIVAIEDDTYWSEGALDPRGTLRAIVHNSGSSGLQGASTLAQQYVKNVKVLQQPPLSAAARAAYYPDWKRKIQDLRLAATVEHQLTPKQLLAGYLNVAYFDNNAWGIDVAAQVYFSETPAQLTLPQAALLAGMVQNPSGYDPLGSAKNVAAALHRRNIVLGRMWQLGYVSKASAVAAENTPLGLHTSSAPLHTGCTAPGVGNAAWFCDYVVHVLEHNYKSVWQQINTTGGLAIHTTLSIQDQYAADDAVNYVEPNRSSTYNPGHNADTEVMVQPGTGDIKAIAINRPYFTGTSGEALDYAVNQEYGGGEGVQTGSSSKIFTLITALEKGLPFSYAIKIKNPDTVGPFTNCKGGFVAPYQFRNSEASFAGQESWELAEATVQSVNTYFANLEQQVGLCNVVKTAVKMGMTRADGTSLLKPDGRQLSADNISSFTLGAVDVSPMNMALAYASVAARGRYCSAQAIESIQVIASAKELPVLHADCYQDMPKGVADAANYILQQVLFSPGTAAGLGIPNRHDAAKTGTANGGFYAAFAGYTPTLAGYVSVFNPTDPTTGGAMLYSNACYRAVGTSYPTCPGQMFGAMAPGNTWELSFLRAYLGPNTNFVYPPLSYFSGGNGLVGPKTIGGKKPKKPGGPVGKGPGGGPTPPSPPKPGHH
jgi:membrane peptidoglycan carboxypeptidase